MICTNGPDDDNARYQRANRDPETAGKYDAHTHNLLTLEVLLQNRRKDKQAELKGSREDLIRKPTCS